jgi:hypothetical protein
MLTLKQAASSGTATGKKAKVDPIQSYLSWKVANVLQRQAPQLLSLQ